MDATQPAAAPSIKTRAASFGLFALGVVLTAVWALIVLWLMRWFYAGGAQAVLSRTDFTLFVGTHLLLFAFPLGASELAAISGRRAYRDGLLAGRVAGATLLLFWLFTAGPIGTLLSDLLGTQSRAFSMLFPPGADPATAVGVATLLMIASCGLCFAWYSLKGDARGALVYAIAGALLFALLPVLMWAAS